MKLNSNGWQKNQYEQKITDIGFSVHDTFLI